MIGERRDGAGETTLTERLVYSVLDPDSKLATTLRVTVFASACACGAAASGMSTPRSRASSMVTEMGLIGLAQPCGDTATVASAFKFLSLRAGCDGWSPHL